MVNIKDVNKITLNKIGETTNICLNKPGSSEKYRIIKYKNIQLIRFHNNQQGTQGITVGNILEIYYYINLRNMRSSNSAISTCHPSLPRK